MKTRSKLGRAISAHMQLLGWNQTKLATEAHMSQGAINRIINQDVRPDVDTLRALCSCWPTPADNVAILIEHLRDEVIRAGKEPGEVEMLPSASPDITDGAAILEQLARKDPNLFAHLLTLLREIDRLAGHELPAIAAESRPRYGGSGAERPTQVIMAPAARGATKAARATAANAEGRKGTR